MIRMEQKKLSICMFVCIMTHQGTVIFNTTKPPGTTPSFTIKSPTQGDVDAALMDHFSLINSYTTFKLINSKVLDLEEFMISYRTDIRTIDLMVTCGGTTVDVFVNVAAVNEFSPVFNNVPYNVTLNASLTVGSLVYALRSEVTDSDVVGAENFIFAIQKYNLSDFDGAAYFNIPMSSKGDITLSKMLDFDTMERSKLFLNLSVSDEPPSSPTAKTTYTTLEIHVADVNDQPPYIEPPYFSFIRLAHIGPLSVTQAIKGKISDTVGTPLVYSIKFGNRQNLFNINPVTGAVNQIRSVNDAGLPDKEFRLIIEVKKDLPSKDLSSIAILTVKVYERISDTDGCIIPPAENSTEVKGFNLTLFLIALGILSCSRSIFI